MIVTLLLLVVIIKFIFFPLLSLITGSALPLVVIESCSLYHGDNFDSWWELQGRWYENRDISKSEFEEFPFREGMNKGDIIFVFGRGDYELGDIIIFQANPNSKARHPIIHRIVSLNPIGTKGDHNPGQLVSLKSNNAENIDETDIPEERIIGKSVVRIPVLGWIKLVFFEVWKDISGSGVNGDAWFCS